MVVSLEIYLGSFFEEHRKTLLNNYPGLTLRRLKQDIKLHAFLNSVDSEELFDFPYLPHRSNPLTLFFDKLKLGVPLEYITGYAYFYRSLFKVTTDVLIPRSETEILVELALSEIQRFKKDKIVRVADIGTGSGVIALSLMQSSPVALSLVASDISPEALRLARENYFNHRYAISNIHQAQFVECDRLSHIDGPFDLILSNPPYIKSESDIGEVHHQVKTFEPHLALFILENLYDKWFLEFFKSIYEKLSPNGVSLIEGHERHLENLADMAKKIGFVEVQVIQDYTQRNRFLKLKK